jgi:SAM-dependent MidA family methyltransferase
MNDDRWLTWRVAMSQALYGESGFYVASDVPARNFRTSAHTSDQWAAAIHALATRVDSALGLPDSFTIIDVGAGGGELLTLLADLTPPRWSLVGVDIAPRPTALPTRVAWRDLQAEPVCGLIIANELLDVVPLDITELTADGLRLVEVSRSGVESIGGDLGPDDADWLARWWPLAEIGDRAEIGRPRDEMWRELTSRLDRGIAVAIDYGAVPERDVAGTMTGYRDGRQVSPVPDGTCDLTAHVLFESLTAEGDVVMSQRDALRALGISGQRPEYDGNPRGYLAALSSVGDAAELLDPGGLGGFTWLIHASGISQPLAPPARS